MKKYYKRLHTFYEVLENGNYIAITPLISMVTVTSGIDFHKSSIETEITAKEFYDETKPAIDRFSHAIKDLIVDNWIQHEKAI